MIALRWNLVLAIALMLAGAFLFFTWGVQAKFFVQVCNNHFSLHAENWYCRRPVYGIWGGLALGSAGFVIMIVVVLKAYLRQRHQAVMSQSHVEGRGDE